MIIVIEPAATLPITIEQIKLALRIDTAVEDETVERVLRASVEAIENDTALALAPTVFEERFDVWPPVLKVTRAPVRAVTSIKFLDPDGVEQTVSPASYSWDRTPEGATIGFVDGFTAPATVSGRPGAVRVTYEAGFNDPAAVDPDASYALPQRASQAVTLLAGHWYANREAVSATGTPPLEIPLALQWVVGQLKIIR